MDGFKKFILRGNVVDLAVGVVIGGAFALVVAGLIDGFINPLIAAIFGKPDISGVGAFTINNAQFSLGLFLNAVLNFLIVAAAIYFFVVVPVNKLMAKRKTEPEVASTTKECPECLSSIPVAAARCAFCTVEQPALA